MSKPKSFSADRIMAVTWRVLKQISRDRRTVGMMIAMPAIIMLIFGFALGGEVKNVPVALENKDAGYTITTGPNANTTVYFSENITSSLQNDDRVKVTICSFNAGKY